MKLNEIQGNLFNSNYSLVHCVSVDLEMSKGIATEFKKRFGHVDDLINQNKKTGQVAHIKIDDIYIFYLITKEKYYGKPTYDALKSSLQELKDLVINYKVKNIAMPRIGCGLDRLDWNKVKDILCDIFNDVDIQIDVYTL